MNVTITWLPESLSALRAPTQRRIPLQGPLPGRPRRLVRVAPSLPWADPMNVWITHRARTSLLVKNRRHWAALQGNIRPLSSARCHVTTSSHHRRKSDGTSHCKLLREHMWYGKYPLMPNQRRLIEPFVVVREQERRHIFASSSVDHDKPRDSNIAS